MIDWSLAKPFYSATHLRCLVAIRDGIHKKTGIADFVNRSAHHLQKDVFPALKKDGYIYYARGAHEWHLSKPWPEIVADVKKRTEWLFSQYLASLDDLMEASPYGEG